MNEPTCDQRRPGTEHAPLVSVVIPTRGRPALLRETLAVDRRPGLRRPDRDHRGPRPRGDRPDAWPSCRGPDREVRSIVNTRTGGLCGARNTGLLASRGDFVRQLRRRRPLVPGQGPPPGRAAPRPIPDLLAVGAGIRLLMGERGNVDWPAREPVVHPRAAAGEPGQGAAQLDADDASLRLRHGRAVRRGAAARLRRGLRLAAARQPGRARSVRSRRSWPTSARTSRPGSADRSLNTAAALEYLLDKHPDFRDRRRGHARILGQIAYARAAAGERRRGLRIAGRALCRYPAAPHAWLALAVAGPGHRAAAAAVGGASARTGAVVSRLPNFLYVGPDKAGSSWLHETLIKHPDVYLTPAKDLYFFDRYYDRGLDVVRRAVPRRAGRGGRRRGLPGLPVPPRGGDPDPARPSARTSGSWSRCATRSSGPGRRTSTCASTASARTPSPRRCAAGPSSSSTAATPPGSTASSQHYPRENVHVALFDDLARDPQGFLDAVTDFLGVDRLPLSSKDLEARLPAAEGPLGPARPRWPAAARTGSASTTAPGSSGRVKRSPLVHRALYRPIDRQAVRPDPTT